MQSANESRSIDVRVKLSALWVVVMCNMAFADILSFITPGVMAGIMTGQAGDIEISQPILLAFALLIEIPIAMIFLSRVLKPRANIWANLAASVVTIAFVVGGGSGYAFYFLFAGVEVASMLLICWLSLRWLKITGAKA